MILDMLNPAKLLTSAIGIAQYRRQRRDLSVKGQAKMWADAGFSPNMVTTGQWQAADPNAQVDFGDLSISDLKTNVTQQDLNKANTQKGDIQNQIDTLELDNLRRPVDAFTLPNQAQTGAQALFNQRILGNTADINQKTAQTEFTKGPQTQATEASTRLSDAQTQTEGTQQDLNVANTDVAKAQEKNILESTVKIKGEIDEIAQRIKTGQAQEDFIRENTNLTRLKAEEQERATKFLASMENYERQQMSTQIKAMEREIEKSKNETIGRDKYLETLYRNNGKRELTDWQTTKMYLWDLFQ